MQKPNSYTPPAPYRPSKALSRMVLAQKGNRSWRQFGADVGLPYATLYGIAERRPGACSRHTAEQIRRALMPAWVGRAADALTARRKAAQ